MSLANARCLLFKSNNVTSSRARARARNCITRRAFEAAKASSTLFANDLLIVSRYALTCLRIKTRIKIDIDNVPSNH